MATIFKYSEDDHIHTQSRLSHYNQRGDRKARVVKGKQICSIIRRHFLRSRAA